MVIDAHQVGVLKRSRAYHELYFDLKLFQRKFSPSGHEIVRLWQCARSVLGPLRKASCARSALEGVTQSYGTGKDQEERGHTTGIHAGIINHSTRETAVAFFSAAYCRSRRSKHCCRRLRPRCCRRWREGRWPAAAWRGSGRALRRSREAPCRRSRGHAPCLHAIWNQSSRRFLRAASPQPGRLQYAHKLRAV